MAYLRPKLEELLHEKQLYDQAWLETKREISALRRQIKGLLLEWQEEGTCLSSIQEIEQRYQEIAIPIRTNMDLETLRLAKRATPGGT